MRKGTGPIGPLNTALGHTVSDNESITKIIDRLSDSLRNRLVLRRIENWSLTRQALVNLSVALETGDRSILRWRHPLH